MSDTGTVPLTGTGNARRMATAAGLLVIGTICYIVPSAVHGNPPVESAARTLQYVADHRAGWRELHLVNIAAVLCWLVALTQLTPIVGARAEGLAKVAGRIFSVAAAVFAVYFSIHATALPTLADKLPASGSAPASLITQMWAVEAVLGAVAFTAQGLLGLSVLLYGVVLVRSTTMPSWLGWLGAVAGAGWLTGAVLMQFSIIVPALTVAWLWSLILAVILLRHARRAV